MDVTTRGGGFVVDLYVLSRDAVMKGYAQGTTRTIEKVWVPRVPVIGDTFVGPEIDGEDYVEGAVSNVEFTYESGFHEAPVVTVTVGGP